MTVEAKNKAADSRRRGQRGSVEDLARRFARTAIEVLTSIMSDPNAPARVRTAAARAVLAFGDRVDAVDSVPNDKAGLRGAVVGVEWTGPPGGSD